MKTIFMALLITCFCTLALGGDLDNKNASKAEKFYTALINTSNTSTFTEAVGLVGQEIHAKKLKGHALHRYMNIYKNWSDYPPTAFSVSNEASELGFDTIAITQDTDGGAYLYVYTSDGDPLVSCSQGESGDFLCD